MFWTWDGYRAATGKWHRTAELDRGEAADEPFAHFLTGIDVALYVAVAAFAASVAAIVFR